MSSHLVRRGGIWGTRMVVPTRLRDAVGKREFNQSCRTHELAIAKLVASVLEGEHSLTLDTLNLATQAWTEQEYHRTRHSEIDATPMDRYLAGPHGVHPLSGGAVGQ